MLTLWLAVMGFLFFLPLIAGVALPEVKILIAVVLILTIYGIVREFFGDGWTTWILTGAGAYYLIYKHFWITTTIWWIYLILGTMAFSAVGWTLITLGRFFKRKRV